MNPSKLLVLSTLLLLLLSVILLCYVSACVKGAARDFLEGLLGNKIQHEARSLL